MVRGGAEIASAAIPSKYNIAFALLGVYNGTITFSISHQERRAAMNNDVNEKKRPGRKPMSPEEKAAAAEARVAEKAKADHLKPEFFVQYQGSDVDLGALAESAKADGSIQNSV